MNLVKKLTLLLLMCATIATATGCGDKSVASDMVSGNKYNNKFIVLADKNGEYILHKGSFEAGYKKDDDIYDLECSDKFISNNQHLIYDNMPTEKFYDEKCEDCFNN